MPAVKLKEDTTRSNGYSKPPVIIFEDRRRAAEQLQAELLKWDIDAQVCASMSELQEMIFHLPSAIFAIDIDMGTNRREEGIEAIRFLRKFQKKTERFFYIAALTTHEEFKLMASQAGADVFLVKISTETDALELVTRMSQHKIEMERVAAEKPQTLLAIREYEELRRQLRAVKESPRRSLSTPMDTVQRALNWPFLMPEEKLILTSLYTQMRAVEGERIDRKTIDLCLQGADMLAKDRARGASVTEWIERARRYSANFTLAWLDEEFFDDEKEEGNS